MTLRLAVDRLSLSVLATAIEGSLTGLARRPVQESLEAGLRAQSARVEVF